MKESPSQRKSGLFWVGVTLLCLVALYWLIRVSTMVTAPHIGVITILVIFSAVPIAIGVYCLIRGWKSEKMSWFKKHLNLTLVLSWIVAGAFFGIFGGNFSWGPVVVGPIISSEAFGGWTGVIGLVGVLVIILFMTGWYLKKKNRSALNYFWYLLFWIGAIILLCLRNQSENRRNETK